MNKLEYGMPTLIELPSIDDCISLCLELKLQFVEINMNMPQYQVDKLDVDKLNQATEKGIYFTFHLDENFNVADFNNKVSEAYLKTALDTIKISKSLNVPIINMHMAEGVHFKLPNQKIYLFEQYNDFYMSSLMKFRNECEKLILDDKLKICIENCNGYLPFMKNGISFLLESDIFQLTFDIGHCHCANHTDYEYILSHKEKLCHMHVHDAKLDKCHLVLGTGEIDLANRLLLAYEKKIRCVIETKSVSGLKDSVAYLRKL